MVIIKALAWVLSLAAVVTWLVALVRWDGSSPVIGANAKAAHFRGATKMARTAPGRNER